MKDLIKQIHGMFDDVLSKVKGGDGDLGRIVINHPDLNHAIVVPLDKWSNINTDRVMDAIERVLNSDQNISIDNSLSIVIGKIKIPKPPGDCT